MSGSLVAVRGAARALDEQARRLLFDRTPETDSGVAAATRAILDAVRRDGDVALRRYAGELDGVLLTRIEVPEESRRTAAAGLAPDLRDALEHAARNIRAAHEAFRPVAAEFVTPDGVRIGRRPDPLERAGVYAPGGRAAYPSSVLMGVIPARVAGVGEVIVCSPPGPDGLPSGVVLAAAELAGADRVFAVGGAGAIAAMAFGTASVPRTDCIVGPGNAWVAEAKAQLAGRVRIDAPAGPSELLVLADDSAGPALIAGELVAQAEHDPFASVALLTTSAALAEDVERELERACAGAAREDVIRRALGLRGAILTSDSADAMLAFAAAYAPEHLLICCRDAPRLAARARNAGTVFVGPASSVAFGDYITGANHVLPTGGAARAWSGLSTESFVRWTTWQEVPEPSARALAGPVGVLARAEGLPAHASAAETWGPAS